MLKCALFVSCAALLTSACNECPPSSMFTLATDTTASVTQNGAAIPGPEAGPDYIALWSNFVLPSADALEIVFDVPLSGPDLEIGVTPNFLFQVMKSVPLTTLTGNELTVGQRFEEPGAMTLVRYDLPPGPDDDPVMQPTPATFWFEVASYAAPVVPAGVTTDFTTPSFLSLSYTSSAATALGTFALQGTITYALNKSTTTVCPPLLDTD